MRRRVCAYGGIAVNLSRYGGGYVLIDFIKYVSALHGVLSYAVSIMLPTVQPLESLIASGKAFSSFIYWAMYRVSILDITPIYS